MKENKKTPTKSVGIYILSKITVVITLSLSLLSLSSLLFLLVFSDGLQRIFLVRTLGESVSLILLSLIIGIGAAFALDYQENIKK